MELTEEFEVEEAEQSTTKNNKKPRRKRNKKKKTRQQHTSNTYEDIVNEDGDDKIDVEIEFTYDEVELDPKNSNNSEFMRIFERFKLTNLTNDTVPIDTKLNGVEKAKSSDLERLKYKLLADEDEDNENKSKKNDESNGQPKISKKKLKQSTRLSVAELKQLVNRPDVVEMHDITARDPKLLVHLKATRNTVPVPRHWCAKRKYLQGKRGIEKSAFELPEFIKRTGISEMRQFLHEKEDSKSLKQKMREKVRPKMGKIDIDYQKLHDAFFRWQTKPKMSIHGDLYYEGKEFETRLKEKKPGNFSDDLRIALGMPTGPNADKMPPPWLIAMQRYGPPPSYPSLKIAGLNAPIPENCSFGYHAGGWGKPPVDEYGRPLYGDVFGASALDSRKPDEEVIVDRSHWGELEIEEIDERGLDEEGEEEEEEEETEQSQNVYEEATDADAAYDGTKSVIDGQVSGISTSVSAGLETPDMIELRKRKIESDIEGSETPALYKVVPEKATSIGSAMMGSSKVYDLSAAKKVASQQGQAGASGTAVFVTLNPDELDLNTDVLEARYNQQFKEQHQSSVMAESEDLSDMVVEHTTKQNKKKRKQETVQATSAQDKDKANKKLKDFKF